MQIMRPLMLTGVSTFVALPAFFFVLERIVCATAPFYQNLSAESPNGRYRFTAISPANEKSSSSFNGGQSEFEFVLLELRTNGVDKVVWKRRQEKNEVSPRAFFVGDDGWSVTWSGRHQLAVIDTTGTKTKSVDSLLDYLTRCERENKLLHSLLPWSPPSWGNYHAYLTTHDFSARHLWGVLEPRED